MNIFEVLKEDHDKQRTLAEILVKTHGDSDGRGELFARLKNELESHVIAEERNFYKPILENDMTIEHARHGIAEHHEMDEMITELENTDYSSPHWKSTAEKLYDKILHHLEDEEQTFFSWQEKFLQKSRKVSWRIPTEKKWTNSKIDISPMKWTDK